MRKPEIDYKRWLTKSEAARALNCNPKTIEREASRGRIEQAWRRVPRSRPAAIFNPDDVARLQQFQVPFVMPEETGSAVANPDFAETEAGDSQAIVPATSPDELLRGLVEALGHGNKGSELFLTVPEAAAYSGLGLVYLRRLIVEGKLALLKGAGPRGADVVWKADLAPLADLLRS
jgi:hypothetical protein